MSDTIYFTFVSGIAIAVIGLSIYLYRYVDGYSEANKKKLAAKPSDTLKNNYKDL